MTLMLTPHTIITVKYSVSFVSLLVPMVTEHLLRKHAVGSITSEAAYSDFIHGPTMAITAWQEPYMI